MDVPDKLTVNLKGFLAGYFLAQHVPKFRAAKCVKLRDDGRTIYLHGNFNLAELAQKIEEFSANNQAKP